MSRLCFSSLCPSLHVFQSNDYVTVFLPFNKEKHPTLQHSNCNHLQKQWTRATEHVLLLAQQVGRVPSLGLHWLPKVCWECGFMLVATPQQLTMPGTQVQLLVGQCVLALWHASSKPCDRNNLLGQEFLTCPLLVVEMNNKDTHWVKRSFRLSSCLLPHCQLWEESSCY